MTNLDNVLKSRDITLPTKLRIVKVVVFSLLMYGCENWTINKAAARGLMLSNCCAVEGSWKPWTAGEIRQSILKESPLNIHWKDWYWSWNTNTLAIWCEELTHWKRPWCWERLRAEEKRTSEGEMARWNHWCNGLELGQTSGDGEGQRGLACHSPRGCKESDMTGRLNTTTTSTNSSVETPAFLSFPPAWMDTWQRRKRLSFYVGLVNLYIHCKYNQG